MIRIGIAENQALVRESLAIVLDLETDMTVAWKIESGVQAVEAMKREPVEVILMDLTLPEMDGVTAIQPISAQTNSTCIIVLTTFDHDEWIIAAINAGATCCFLKEVPPKLLIKAIRSIHSGHFSPDLWSDDWRNYAPEIQFKAKIKGNKTNSHLVKIGQGQEHFTHRDLEVLRRIGRDMTNLEIAQALFLTEETVKNYISILYQKIGVHNRSEVIRYAKDNGLI